MDQERSFSFSLLSSAMTIEQHTEAIHKATTLARELTSANLEGWIPQGEKNGIKVYTKDDGKLIRGDYVLKTSSFTYEQCAAVATSTIVRPMCKLQKKE